MTLPHPTPPLHCLSDLEIADLIAGRLHGEARDRALRHVAECETCFEIYAEAQALLETTEDEAEDTEAVDRLPAEALPQPLPFPPPAKGMGWFPAIAAGLIAGIALALFMPGQSKQPPEAALWPQYESLPAAVAAARALPPIPGSVDRGPNDASKDIIADFFLGVEWSHLEEAWRRQNLTETAVAAGNVRRRLETRPESLELPEDLGQALVAHLEILERAQQARAAPGEPSALDDLTRRLSHEMRELGYEFDLGRFAEAGRLAAAAGALEFFAPGGRPARYLREMRSWNASSGDHAEKLTVEAERSLDAIAAAWPAGEGSLTGVQQAFSALILSYDR